MRAQDLHLLTERDYHEVMKAAFKLVRKKPNVTGFSGVLQPRQTNGEYFPSDKVFRVYVENKLEETMLKAKDLVPSKIDVVTKKNRFTVSLDTDVVDVGPMLALDERKKIRPAPAGCSAMAAGGTACTLGWFARDKTDGHVVVISNNHCTSGENKLPQGHAYMQPSPYDGGQQADVIGTLKRFVPIEFTGGFACPFRSAFGFRTWLRNVAVDLHIAQQKSNLVDLGVVEPIDPESLAIEVMNLGNVTGKRSGTLFETAHKTGRTTGHTEGAKLIDNNYYGNIGYSRGVAYFGPCGLLEGNDFSAGGDSSSAIVWSKDDTFAGLLFAGSTTHTMFCHWDYVENYGELEILTSQEVKAIAESLRSNR